MARETKEIYCIRLGDHYDVVDYYKMFDWKLERYEKYKDWTGEAERSPKVTFFDLFFSRDKDTPWYNRVCALEEEYNDIRNNDYEKIKTKYNYEAKSKIGKKPIEPEKPKLSEPLKFFNGSIVFVFGILMLLIGISQEGEFHKILSYIGGVVATIGAIVLLLKTKYLTGLRGKEKRKVLEKHSKYKINMEKYKKEVEKFFESRKHEIEEELKKILNF